MSGPDLNRAAELALALDWALTPLRSRGKEPLLKGWQKREVATEEDVRGWIDEGYNLGVRTGSVSGIVVLDDDTGTQAGAAHFDLPPTVTAETSPGKRHYYYAAPEGVTIGNSVGKLYSMPDPSGALDARGQPKKVGLDVRGDGGQVVLSGSIHPETGEPYRWLDGHGPDEVPVAELPANVLKAIQEKGARPERAASPRTAPPVKVAATLTAAQQQRIGPYVSAIVEGELEKLRVAQEGTRNSTLNNVALRLGHLVGAGLIDEDETGERLAELAEEIRLEPGEIEATIRSGMSAGIDRPEDVPALLARLEKQDADLLAEFGNFLRGERSANRAMPDDTEADNLTTTIGGNSRPCATARKKAAGKVIKKADPRAYAACFEAGELPGADGLPRAEQFALLRTKVIEPVVAALVPHEEFDPRLVYALVYKLTKDHGAEGWRESVWKAVLEAWDATEAELDAQRAEQERAEQERKVEYASREESILAGQRETFIGEEIPDDPDEAGAWSRRRLVFKAESDYFLIDAWTGCLSPQPYSRDQLSRAIEEHGLDGFLPLTEPRGRVVVYLSGQEIVNRARPWAISRVTERIGLKHPLLERDGKQYVLVLPQYELADIEPEFNADIDAWVEHTFGDRAEDVRDWFATVPEVSRPTRALVIEGPPGIGKDIPPTGSAQVFRDAEFTRRAFERFNGPLATNPVVFLDEGLPGNAHGGSVSEKFREFISGGTLPVEQKGKEIRSVEVRPRVIIATNDLEKIVARLAGDRLNRSSTLAVEDRILAVRVTDDAASYLNSRKNWEHTQHWCDPSKRLFAKYVLWLHRERIERLRAAGGRFLGAPSSERLLDSYVYDDPLTIAFVETVCRLIARPVGLTTLVGPGEPQEPGLYLQRSALEQTIGMGLGKDRSAPDAIEIESAGARAGLLEVPSPKIKFKLKGAWSQLNARAWRTVKNWPLLHEIAQRNGCEHLDALERYLVSIEVLDSAEYGSEEDGEGSGLERPNGAIFDRVRARMGRHDR